ncbi:SIR2 family protein [Mycolicibacterium sp. CBM1]
MVPEGLVAAVRDNELIVVCGAGITAATAPSSPYGSWRSLLEHGIQTVVDYDNREAEWAENVRKSIELARHPSDYVNVAESVTIRLGKRNFPRWLTETVGSISPEKPELIEAIAQLSAPIATTNYDTLVERVTNRDAITWQNPDNMHRALAGKLRAVMHLHGVHLEPKTVVFGSQSYGKILENNGAQSVQWLLAGGKTLLFVGASGTLEDPNLGKMIDRIDESIQDSTITHYMICRESDRDNLLDQYRDTPISVISFGSDNYDDLPTFIQEIATLARKKKDEISPINYRSAAQMVLIEKVQNQSVIALDQKTRSDDLSTFVIPPVLLAAPHDTVIAALDDYTPGESDIRADAEKDASSHDVVVLVGEEISGVTTALEWFALKRAEVDNTAIPIFLEYGELMSWTRSLDRLIRRSISDYCDIPPREPLNNIVLAIDDVVPIPGDRKFERLIDDLRSEWITAAFLSCSLGSEADLTAALQARGFNPLVRYTGHLTRRDVFKLTRLAVDDDARAEAMAEKIFDTLGAEGLPKTAWHVTLLLDIFLHTTLTIQSLSSASLLDQFVNLLLGRELLEDSRLSIDARDREAILSALASLYARKRMAALPETEVVELFSKLFEEFGWDESPTAMLESLKKRHILASRKGDRKEIVRFAQPSYLYLFAAKQAKEDIGFKESLLEDPLVYSKIITHYTSLVRSDEWVLTKIHELLKEAEGSVGQAAIFGPKPAIESEMTVSASLSALIERATNDEGRPQNDDKDDEDESEGDEDDLDDDEDDEDELDSDLAYIFDHAMSRSSDPFPTRSIKDAPQIPKALAALSLVSMVLRDSELVRNMTLKVEILTKTLRLWADMIYSLEQDQKFVEMGVTLADQVADALNKSETEKANIIAEVKTNLPVVFTTNVMVNSLASKKLDKALQECFETALDNERDSAILTAILTCAVETKSWTSNFAKVGAKYSDSLAVSDLMFKLAYHYYIHEKLSADQRADLEKFLQSVLKQAKKNAAKFIDHLRGERARKLLPRKSPRRKKKGDLSHTDGSPNAE